MIPKEQITTNIFGVLKAPEYQAMLFVVYCGCVRKSSKNSSGDEIANVNFYAVRPEATRIRWNNAK